MTSFFKAILGFLSGLVTELGKYLLYKKIGRQEAKIEDLKRDNARAEGEAKLHEEYEQIEQRANDYSRSDPDSLIERMRSHRDYQAGREDDRMSSDS